MDQQRSFAGENIDKSKILISNHAKDQFIARVGEAYRHFRCDYAPKKSLKEKVGLPLVRNHQEAEPWIRLFLEKSIRGHAATNGKSIDAVLKYLKTGELTFFLRYERWQFVIKRCTEDSSRFVVKTIIWLDDGFYSRTKKSK